MNALPSSDPMPARFSTRPFARSDAQFVVRAHSLPHVAPFVSGAPSEEQVVGAMGNANLVERIVLSESEPVGLWRARVHDDWLVELLLVIATVPRLGIGRFAIQDAKRHAFDDIGAHRMWLEVTAANAAARALYESEGFVHEGTYRDGFRNGDGSFEDLAHYGMLAREHRPSAV